MSNEEALDVAEDDKPRVESLKDLINYQEGSVVSREIVRKPKGP